MKSNHLKIYAIVILSMLGLLSFVLSVIPAGDKLIALIASYAFVISIAMLVELDFKSIGLSKSTIKNGFRFALPFMLLIVAGGIILFLMNPELFRDTRYQLDTQSLLYKILVVLPIYTVIIEELTFRGVLFSTLMKLTSRTYALVISSLAFGLWHYFTASTVNFGDLPQIFIVCAVILATSLAGVFFTWLRIKSDSLIAPILVHWTINATGIILAYFAWLN